MWTKYYNSLEFFIRQSKINLDIVLPCLNIQDNNRYNIFIQFSIPYEDCGVKNVKNLVLS